MTWVQRQIDGVRETAALLRWQHVVVTLVRCLGLVALLCYGWYGFTHYVVVPFLEDFAQQGPLSQAGIIANIAQHPAPAVSHMLGTALLLGLLVLYWKMGSGTLFAPAKTEGDGDDPVA